MKTQNQDEMLKDEHSRGRTMITTKRSTRVSVVFSLLLLCTTCRRYGVSAEEPATSCIDAERKALLSFKHDLHATDPNRDHPLSSWGNESSKRDCCKWLGIRCANDSGHVMSLEIFEFGLRGKLNPSLFELRHLTSLSLKYINFSNTQIPPSIASLSNLRKLHLAQTSLTGNIPSELRNLSKLEILRLSGNDLYGSIPDIFWNMTGLEDIRVDENMLEGELPRSIWNLSGLTNFEATLNKLEGHLPTTMSQLKLLTTFDLSRNLFQGEITEAHFANLSKLTVLDISSNSFNLNFPPNWTPPFRLAVIMLGSCKLGPHFPKWLQTQTNYTFLNISGSAISDHIPAWFWCLSSQASIIDLSHNQISGGIDSCNISVVDQSYIDLSSNRLQGSIPSFFTQFAHVNLFQNRFSSLNFSCNINNEIHLEFLDISNNLLSGELPDCWSEFKSLKVLILSNNHLSGRVPPSFGSLDNLVSVNLNKNRFTGEIPTALKNCTNLAVIDFGENNFSGTIPAWFGSILSELIILSLRFNNFNGGIPISLCRLYELTVLDFSSNNISGSIPKCINNLSSMGIRNYSSESALSLGFQGGYEHLGIGYSTLSYDETLELVWKGGIAEFKTTLALLKTIDLSSNKLIGEIPTEITHLSGLVSLNLSRNNLSGQIPKDIGRLKSLDSLDISRNHLIGQIPQSLTQIYGLSALDLSNNNLSGKIPTGTQLQSFEYAYWGNAKLCGDPLPEKCWNATVPIPKVAHHDELLNRGFYTSMVIGFVTAFWGVCGVLIFNKRFRYAYFKLLNCVGDWVYVKIKIQRAKVIRIIRG